MALVHELGHVLWGIVMGGSLSYIQIAYLIVYPRIAVAEQFCLGLTQMSGLGTSFQHGLFPLGGSLSTNILVWLFGLLLLKKDWL